MSVKLCVFSLFAINFLMCTEICTSDNRVTMPSEEILSQRLEQYGLNHFIAETKLPASLAGKKKSPAQVAVAWVTRFDDYSQAVSNKQVKHIMQLLQPYIFEALLQDEPTALQELARYKIYTPTKGAEDKKGDKVVIMPSKEILSQKLVKHDLKHFMEKTELVTSLADKKLQPLGVAMLLELALDGYSRSVESMQVGVMMQVSKSDIFEVLLQDAPTALQELAVCGLYEGDKHKE